MVRLLLVMISYALFLSQMIPEDPVLFGGTIYDRELAENYVRLSMTKVLPRRSRSQRHVFDPVNPGRIIKTNPVDGEEVEDDSEMDSIINSILIDAGPDWETRLRHEINQARISPLLTIQTSDGKIDCCFLYFFVMNSLTSCLYT